MIISVQGPTYFSPGDEGAFFHWLNSIKAVRSWRPVGAGLELQLARKTISDRDLRELYAFFRRCAMDLRLLEPLNQPRPERLRYLSAWVTQSPKPRAQSRQ